MSGLPIEITTIILSRLPIRSVLKFMSVCKTWCSIITTSSFANMHISINSSSEIPNPSSLILLPLRYIDELFIIDENHTSKIAVPSLDDSRLFPAGSSNGFLCFSSYNQTHRHINTTICNPTTQEYVCLPNLTLENFGWAYIGSGFGFNPSTKQFTILYMYNYLGRQIETQVYTSGSNSWRNAKKPRLEAGYFSNRIGLFFNGSIHWFALFADGGKFIMLFDLENEKFGIIPIPEFSLPSIGNDFELEVLGGCLSISDCSLDDRYEIWVMKDYKVKQSWTKQYVIRKNLIDGRRIDVIHPIFFRKNGELVLLCDSRFLVSYNLQSGKATQLEGDYPKYHAFPYVGNLISAKLALQN